MILLCVWSASSEGDECSKRSYSTINGESSATTSFICQAIYILLTKRESRSGRISARGPDSTDRAQRGPYKKDWGQIFSQYGPEQAWLIRDLLHNWKCLEKIPRSRTGKNWKNIATFKRAILTGSRLGVYSRLMLNKNEGKESWKKKKRSLLCESKFFQKRKL